VLRYWEQEFTQLKPMKRRGNRRYYQHHEVLLVRRIRDLLYDQGFTISGARNRLIELGHAARGSVVANGIAGADAPEEVLDDDAEALAADDGAGLPLPEVGEFSWLKLRRELLSIRDLLEP
jgi:DNA-binding transcriptional MerR regulator